MQSPASIGTEYQLSGFWEESNGQREYRYDIHHQGKNVAYVVMKTNNGRFYLDGLYVSPKHRGHGLAVILMQTAIDQHGNEDIHIKANPFKEEGLSIEQLVEFYQRFGFQATGEDPSLLTRPKTK